MGKKKDGKVRIPKTIAGMKVPKDVRKTGNALLEKADTPAGRQALATGLTIAATAVAGAIAANQQRRDTKAEAKPAAGATTHDPRAAAEALTGLATTMFNRFFQPDGSKPH